jgi:CheY-like chemotaxis protein
MAIVRHLVELHGGTVRAESAGENKGATFTLSLPVRLNVQQTADGGPASRAGYEEEPQEQLPQLDRVRVLVVDDDPDSRDFVCQLFENHGAIVSSAASTAEAWSTFVRRRPDVLVSDIGMPDEDGYALIRRVRMLSETEGGNTPAVAVTAYARHQDASAALAAGYDRYIPKPVVVSELIAAVAQLATKATTAAE